MIAEDQLNLLASIITNQKHHRLPIVYVSKTHDNENPVEIDPLAARLKGIVHVLVQESISTNPELKELCLGEIKDLILMVLSEAGHNMDEDSRRHDVVYDVIIHNDDRKTTQQKVETVKRLLKNYTGITAKLRQ